MAQFCLSPLLWLFSLVYFIFKKLPLHNYLVGLTFVKHLLKRSDCIFYLLQNLTKTNCKEQYFCFLIYTFVDHANSYTCVLLIFIVMGSLIHATVHKHHQNILSSLWRLIETWLDKKFSNTVTFTKLFKVLNIAIRFVTFRWTICLYCINKLLTSQARIANIRRISLTSVGKKCNLIFRVTLLQRIEQKTFGLYVLMTCYCIALSFIIYKTIFRNTAVISLFHH